MNRNKVLEDRKACPKEQVYRAGRRDSECDWKQILALDFTESEDEESDVVCKLEKCKNARYLVLDQTKIGPAGILRLLRICRRKERLNFISALDDKYDTDQSMVDELVKWEDRFTEELKKNVNIYSLDLINDEGKQNSILPKIKHELKK